ncbi:MAG: hypothetical protein ABI445_24970 [Polyangia bacterium]
MSLGVLSVHLDGAPCSVACSFCYLGAREHDGLVRDLRRRPDELALAVQHLDYDELAVALSDPALEQDAVTKLVAIAAARNKPTAITTTPQIVLEDPSCLRGATRLNLSVDPWKLPVDLLDTVRAAAEAARAHVRQVVAVATLSTPGFSAQLVDGLLQQLLELPALDGVALNALKPPPPFCDRDFWLRTLAKLAPLLDSQLERRLHLDCYVAARLLKLGGCPGRADVTPAAGGLAFRSCVYAPAADRVESVAELERSTEGFVAPVVCPFDTRI